MLLAAGAAGAAGAAAAAAHRRRARPAGAAADAAGHHRLELRPARARGADPLPPPRGLRRRLHASRRSRRSPTRTATWTSSADWSACVEHSLCARRKAGGEPRFRMLETIREFGLEQLERAARRRPPAIAMPTSSPCLNEPILTSSAPIPFSQSWTRSNPSMTTRGRRCGGRGRRATTTRSSAWPGPSPGSGITAATSTKASAGSARRSRRRPILPRHDHVLGR